MLAARHRAIRELKQSFGDVTCDEYEVLSKLTAYCSQESHSCVEKAAKIGLVSVCPRC